MHLACSYKCWNNVLIYKTLNVEYSFEIIKIYFKCEIKTASRCEQVTVDKGVIVTEPNHLDSRLIQEGNTVIAQRHKIVLCLCLELFLLSKWSKNRQYGV